MTSLQLVILMLSGVAVLLLGGAAIVVRRIREDARKARERAVSDAPVGGMATGMAASDSGGGAPRLFETVNKLGEAVSAGKTSKGLKANLAAAGYHTRSAAAIYLGAKVILFAGGVASLSAVLLPLGMPMILSILLIVFGSSTLFFIPNIVVSMRRTKRRKEVRTHLPDAVDMLEICVSAGMGLDAAWTAVSDEIRRVSSVFADEMELTSLEISLGVPRAIALRHMADRTGADDLSSLVALLVQSERFGAGIVEALTNFARSMREARSQRAEEAAEKMSVKLLFPMVMFIFPALLIVMVGPAVIELVRVMGSQ